MPVIELLQMSNPSVFFFFEHADLRLQANILAITPLLVVRRKPTSMQTCAHQQSVPTKQQCTAHIRLSKKCLQASRSSFACRQLPALQKQRTQGKMPRCRAVRRLDVQAVSLNAPLSTSCSCRARCSPKCCLSQVIPQLQGDATEQTPPDLPSYLFKERIVYLVSFQATALYYRCCSVLHSAEKSQFLLACRECH